MSAARDGLPGRIAELQRKLVVRDQNKVGFKKNVRAIRAELARLQVQLDGQA